MMTSGGTDEGNNDHRASSVNATRCVFVSVKETMRETKKGSRYGWHAFFASHAHRDDQERRSKHHSPPSARACERNEKSALQQRHSIAKQLKSIALQYWPRSSTHAGETRLRS